ncbi:MAG: S41 family peptidase [Ahrensia sp.]|nr:S41 family peptidase [Ahrensia sp.]
MIRKVTLWVTGAAVGALGMMAAHQGGLITSKADAAGAEVYRQLDIFGDIFERVRSQYVSEPDEKELIKNAINGMLQSLDPHSSYLDPEESADMRTQTSGKFGGLGIEVTMENELVKVIAPIDDTPAAKAGVLSGDLISQIDGENVRGMSLQDAVKKMRGLINTPIVLTILRSGADRPLKIKIVRDEIVVKSVKYRVEGDDIGYLDVNGFTEQTYKGMEDAIRKIRDRVPNDQLKGYVLDLRLNPGGLLFQAISVSDAFLDRGEIVSTRGRKKDDVERKSATPGDLTRGKPVVVLVNGGSASASEIVAGALQDHRRATVLGTRSFGKGSVQTIIPLGRNGALRMTTALYYTPSGCSIQGKGIDPDIRVEQPLPEELQGRVEARGESNLRNSIEGESQDDSGSGSFAYVPPDPKDDLQLKYAMDLLRGNITNAAFPPNKDDVLGPDSCKRV